VTTFKQRMKVNEPKYQPCPFCGNKDQQWIGLVKCEENEHSVRCGKCSATGPLNRYKSAALAAWNYKKELTQ
jgi:Lar family restriction alleviation protein